MFRTLFNRNYLPNLLLALVLAYFLFSVGYHLGAVFLAEGGDFFKGCFSQCFIRMFFSPGSECLPLPSLLMQSPYVGQVQQYLGAVFIFLFSGFWGPVFSFKLTMVFIGVVSLVSIFLVLRYFFGPWVALLTVFFMGTNCVYIQTVRYGFLREEILQIAGLWFGLYLLVRGAESRKRFWIYSGLFVFGITLWTKVMFLGYMAGAFVGMFVLGKTNMRSLRRFLFPSLGTAVLRIGTFCLGVFPLVFYNLTVESGRTSHTMLWLYKEAGVVGSFKLLFGIFLLRLDDISRYCLGTLYRSDYGANWFGAIVIFCAFVWCLRLVFVFPRDNRLRRFLAFVLVFYTVLLLLSCFIITIHWRGHVVIATPFAELLCAVFVVDVCSRIRNRRAVATFVVAVVAGWIGFHARYEAIRILNQDSRKGYLHYDFQVSDMEAIINRLHALGVRNLYCGEYFSFTVRFFLQDEYTIACRGVDVDYDTRIDLDEPWYLLTKHSVLECEDEESLRKEYWPGVRLEPVEVFDTPLSCYPKMYLHRIHKADSGQSKAKL